jgi:hypothetical protein
LHVAGKKVLVPSCLRTGPFSSEFRSE